MSRILYKFKLPAVRRQSKIDKSGDFYTKEQPDRSPFRISRMRSKKSHPLIGLATKSVGIDDLKAQKCGVLMDNRKS